MADGNQESRDLFLRANDAYLSGNIGQALSSSTRPSRRAGGDPVWFLLVQKAGWLRESGYPEESAKHWARRPANSSGCRSRLRDAMVMLRMEQGMAAQQRGDFSAAEALLAEAEELAKKSPARDVILTDVFATRPACT